MIRSIQESDYTKGISELLVEKYNKAAISHDIFTNRLGIMRNQGAEIFVVEYNTKIIGMIKVIQETKFSPDKDAMGHVEDLYIKKEYTSQGYGTKLIQYSIDWLQKRGVYKIVLGCNKSLVSFYSKFGMQEYNNTLMTIYYI